MIAFTPSFPDAGMPAYSRSTKSHMLEPTRRPTSRRILLQAVGNLHSRHQAIVTLPLSATARSYLGSQQANKTKPANPSTVQQNYLSVIIISQVSGGIYLWEWVTTLYFDLRLLSGGRQGFKWPSLVYISSRISTLITIICEFIFLNRKFEKHCNAMIHVILFFGYLATILSSTLIAIRITGIWNRKRPVIIFAVSVILADIVMILYAFIRGRGAAWNPVLQACIEIDTIRVQTSAVAVFVLDVLMFVVMIIGIWMMRASGSLWRVVYHQGIIWFLVAVIAYTPLVVLISLNLNDAINRLWQTPFFVAMTICAARMHRGLFEHANSYPSTEEKPCPSIVLQTPPRQRRRPRT